MNFTCPNCGLENAYFDTFDENGSHYLCPDCEYKWTDSSDEVEDEEADSEDVNDE
jgi:transposase-like protein